MAGIGVGVVALLTAAPLRREEQRARDERARESLDAAAKGVFDELVAKRQVAPFALYLHPFKLDHSLYAPGSAAPGLPFAPGFWLGSPSRELFETYLAAELKLEGTDLVALGRPSDLLGAGRIETENAEWFLKFETLVGAAREIVCIVGAQPGIVRELKYLRANGLLWKTTMVKPAGYPRSEWDEARSVLSQLGIELPHWSRGLLTVSLLYSGRIRETHRWFVYPVHPWLRMGSALAKSIRR